MIHHFCFETTGFAFIPEFHEYSFPILAGTISLGISSSKSSGGKGISTLMFVHLDHRQMIED